MAKKSIKKTVLDLAVRALPDEAEKPIRKALGLTDMTVEPKRKPTRAPAAEAQVKPKKALAVKKVPARPEGGLRGADSPLMISTRRPSAPNFATQGNPDEALLIQSGSALRDAPESFGKNMAQLAEEPFMARVGSPDPEAIARYGTEQGARNLEFITTDLMDPDTVAAARGWYPTAQMVSERAARAAGLPPEAGYGVTAVTSPQSPWDTNVAKMERLFQMQGNQFETDPAAALDWARQRLASKYPGAVAGMGEDWVRRVAETPMQDLPKDSLERYGKVVLADALQNSPAVRRIDLSGEYGAPTGNITWGSGSEINKALNILNDPSMANINEQMLGGGKVPSFYNNIAAPFSSAPIATIDTHSAGAASLSPGGGKDPIVYRGMGLSSPGAGYPLAAASPATTGAKGLYGPLVDMHTLAGERLGMLPREVQSATWEGVRDLWGQTAKTPVLKKRIADIWRTASSEDEARFAIAELLGKPVRRMYEEGGSVEADDLAAKYDVS